MAELECNSLSPRANPLDDREVTVSTGRSSCKSLKVTADLQGSIIRNEHEALKPFDAIPTADQKVTGLLIGRKEIVTESSMLLTWCVGPPAAPTEP